MDTENLPSPDSLVGTFSKQAQSALLRRLLKRHLHTADKAEHQQITELIDELSQEWEKRKHASRQS